MLLTWVTPPLSTGKVKSIKLMKDALASQSSSEFSVAKEWLREEAQRTGSYANISIEGRYKNI